jgi:hypothetical protein
MAPKATPAPSTRLDPPLAEHQRHVRRRRRTHDGPPGQRPRQRAGPRGDATDARSSLHRGTQAHTALRTYRQHAGLGGRGGLCRRRHGIPQGDGSDDDAGKQLPVRTRVPHLVPCHSVCTRTLAHAYFPDTTFSLPRPFALYHCCCCSGQCGSAKVPRTWSPSRAVARSVVEDPSPFLSVPSACLCAYPDTDVS